MIDKESLRKMCEYEYAPSLIGEILSFAGRKETAEERARRRWGMEGEKEPNQ
jgi:hypothetical protein